MDTAKVPFAMRAYHQPSHPYPLSTGEAEGSSIPLSNEHCLDITGCLAPHKELETQWWTTQETLVLLEGTVSGASEARKGTDGIRGKAI